MAGVKSEDARPAKWWLPDQPGDAVPGLYWVDETGAARATLHGHLKGGPRPLGASSVPLLHGNVLGEMVTLCDAQSVSGTTPMAGDVVHREVVARVALEGLALASDELHYDRAVFSLRSQAAWSDWTTWRDADEDDPSRPPRLEHVGLETRALSCSDATLSLADDAMWTQEYDTWTLISGCRFELDLDAALALDDLDYNWLRPLQLLLTTATGAPSPVLRLSLSNTAWEFEDGHRRDPSEWVRVRFSSSASQAAPRMSSFYCRHLASDFEDVQLVNFFEAAAHHRYALERYADASSGSTRSRETVFLNLIQAVEALDDGLHDDEREPWQADAESAIASAMSAAGISSRLRRLALGGIRRAHLRSLASRLRRVDQQSAGVVTALAGGGWADDVAILRNAVTHGRTGDVFRKSSGALIVATEISRLLFDLRWLMVLGFSAEDAHRLVTRRASQWADADLIREHAHLLRETAEALKAL